MVEQSLGFGNCEYMRSLRSHAFLTAELAIASAAAWLSLTLLRDYVGRPVAWTAAGLVLAGTAFGLYRSFRKV
jgi:hypothetical protein